jgi:hypothetical protein
MFIIHLSLIGAVMAVVVWYGYTSTCAIIAYPEQKFMIIGV